MEPEKIEKRNRKVEKQIQMKKLKTKEMVSTDLLLTRGNQYHRINVNRSSSVRIL